MGNLLPNFTKNIIEEINNSIFSNTSQYYAFASFSANTPSLTEDQMFVNEWQLLFGKQLNSGNFLPVISNIIWTSNTVYSIYDNHIDLSNTNFYAAAQTVGYYHIYKCMDNANGSPSISNPSAIALPTQTSTFQTADNYKWKYITSITNAVYNRFATDVHMPIYSNVSVVSSAAENSGVDNILISNGGFYNTYHNGIVQGGNSSIIQVAASANTTLGYYNNNSIYLYNSGSPTTSQLFQIANYFSNSSGNWVVPNSSVNSASVTAGVTSYSISPSIIIQTDGTIQPLAYSVINASSNSISNAIIINSGSNITWANVSVFGNPSYGGSGANLQAIVPPPGGHGYDPVTELYAKGIGVYFTFSNTESATIPTNVLYNGVGIAKNPYGMNTSTGVISSVIDTNTFSAYLNASFVTPLSSTLYTVGDTVTGNTSGAVGTVVFCNTSTIYLTGDKYFVNGEYIVNSGKTLVAQTTINTLGSVYTKNFKPFYVQSVSTVSRSNTQNEAFKLIIQI